MNHNLEAQSSVDTAERYPIPIQRSATSSSNNRYGQMDDHTLNEIENNLYKYNVLSILRRIEAN